jgi:hypothetical protein
VAQRRLDAREAGEVALLLSTPRRPVIRRARARDRPSQMASGKARGVGCAARDGAPLASS